MRAFEIYEEHGRQDGHDLDDWFRAEQEVLGRRMDSFPAWPNTETT